MKHYIPCSFEIINIFVIFSTVEIVGTTLRENEKKERKIL